MIIALRARRHKAVEHISKSRKFSVRMSLAHTEVTSKFQILDRWPVSCQNSLQIITLHHVILLACIVLPRDLCTRLLWDAAFSRKHVFLTMITTSFVASPVSLFL